MIRAVRRWLFVVPGDVWLVGLVALAMGTTWSLLTPLFQVPDEPAHYSYVQYLGETGLMPDGSTARAVYSSQQEQVMAVLGTYTLIGRSTRRVERSDPGAVEQLKKADSLPRNDGGGSTTSSSQPPLYYASAALAYRASGFLGATAQVRSVRLYSVGLFALGAMLAGLLCGELFPSVPWARALGGASVAVAPVPGFIAGGVTPDNLLNTIAIGLTLAMVVGVRRPSRRHAVAVGILAGLGVVTKLTFAGMVPAAALAIVIIAWRLRRTEGNSAAAKALILGGGAMCAPVAVYLLWATAQGRPLVPVGVSTPVLPASAIPAPSLREHLSYAWQLYLPRMPWQTDFFGFSPINETWVGGWLGRYGWLDYGANSLMREVGTWLVWILSALTVSGLARHWAAIRRSLAEALCCLVLALGLAATIALVGYDYKRTTGYVFEQVRYLFPLLGLYAAGITAASLGLGRRAAPTVAVVIMVVLSLHGLSGLVLTVARYYAS